MQKLCFWRNKNYPPKKRICFREQYCIYCVYTVRTDKNEVILLLNLTEFSTSALHHQIADHIIIKVVNGELRPGDEIESVGVLAREQHVGKKTVKKAYEELERLNILEFKNDYGYYIKKYRKKN